MESDKRMKIEKVKIFLKSKHCFVYTDKQSFEVAFEKVEIIE